MGLLGKKETKESESEAVRILKEAGAVVYVKTNVPSGMMVSWFEVFLLVYILSLPERHSRDTHIAASL